MQSKQPVFALKRSALPDELNPEKATALTECLVASRGTGKYLIMKYSEAAGKINGEKPEKLRDGAYQTQHKRNASILERRANPCRGSH